ncbi:hypothetical protein ACWF94_15305 [Streptomyces sp. NPDC055078]
MEDRSPRWGAGCLTLVLGGVAGYGASRVSGAARRECAVVLREFPSVFDWWTWETPLSVVAGALAGVVAWVVPTAVCRSRTGALVVTGAAFAVVVVVLALTHMAWLGTPAGAGTHDESGCSPEHVPPWWPAWLPA